MKYQSCRFDFQPWPVFSLYLPGMVCFKLVSNIYYKYNIHSLGCLSQLVNMLLERFSFDTFWSFLKLIAPHRLYRKGCETLLRILWGWNVHVYYSWELHNVISSFVNSTCLDESICKYLFPVLILKCNQLRRWIF